MVKRVSGVDFNVEIAPRRLGDPAQIVAASNRIRTVMGRAPQYDDSLPSLLTRSPGNRSCDDTCGWTHEGRDWVDPRWELVLQSYAMRVDDLISRTHRGRRRSRRMQKLRNELAFSKQGNLQGISRFRLLVR